MKPSMEDVDARSALGLTAGKRFRLQELPARRAEFPRLKTTRFPELGTT